ncbi:MAG: TM0996/MTH895 family glutaredoxin-like protein [Bacteroidaceae bacterium]|nr:TM0996/MTH895 family glutaredoxin-like protein [Bacteroidaceae bacterium]
MEVKVLGACCAKCKATYSIIEKVVRENDLDVTLSKVTDMAEIVKYNVMTLPAVCVDGEVRIKGRVPSESEVKALLGV